MSPTRSTDGWTRSLITTNGVTVITPAGGVYQFRSIDTHGTRFRAFWREDGTMATPLGDHTWTRERLGAISMRDEQQSDA